MVVQLNKTSKFVFFLFIVSFVTFSNTSYGSALEQGENAHNFTLETNTSKSLSLEELKGKIVVINFWTTWCTYCQEELAELTTFYEAKKEDVDLIAVNLTSSEQSKQEVLQFINHSNIPFTVLMDVNGEVAAKYKIIGIPTTFIINKKGMVIKKVLGPVTAEMLSQIIDGM